MCWGNVVIGHCWALLFLRPTFSSPLLPLVLPTSILPQMCPSTMFPFKGRASWSCWHVHRASGHLHWLLHNWRWQHCICETALGLTDHEIHCYKNPKGMGCLGQTRFDLECITVVFVVVCLLVIAVVVRAYEGNWSIVKGSRDFKIFPFL